MLSSLFTPTIGLGSIATFVAIIAAIYTIRGMKSSIQQGVIDAQERQIALLKESLEEQRETSARAATQQRETAERAAAEQSKTITDLRARVKQLEETNVEAFMVEWRKSNEQYQHAFEAILAGLEGLKK